MCAPAGADGFVLGFGVGLVVLPSFYEVKLLVFGFSEEC